MDLFKQFEAIEVGFTIATADDERESMDYPDFIARVTSHIPDKGQVMVRYYNLC